MFKIGQLVPLLRSDIKKVHDGSSFCVVVELAPCDKDKLFFDHARGKHVVDAVFVELSDIGPLDVRRVREAVEPDSEHWVLFVEGDERVPENDCRCDQARCKPALWHANP